MIILPEHYPKVSVLMTTRDRPHLIGGAVNRILTQTFKNFELIITDASSGNRTKKIVLSFKNPRITYLKANGGIARGRNMGLRHAKGEYIAYCDDDELYYPGHIAKLKEFLDRNQDIGLVYCDALRYTESNKTSSAVSHGFDKKKLEITCFFGVGNVMHRRECIDKVGLFDENLSICEDWDMWLRISDYFKIAHLPKILHKYIIHGTNVTSQGPDVWGEAYEYIIRKRLKRLYKNKDGLQNYICESSFGITKTLLWLKRFNFAGRITKKFYRITKNHQTAACLGIYYLSSGDFFKALDLFKESLVRLDQKWQEIDPLYLSTALAIKVYLANAFYHSGRIKMALDVCLEVLKTAPENMEAKIQLARCYIRKNLVKKALDLLRPKANAGLGLNPQAKNLRGYCYFKMKNYPFAIREFSNAAALEPSVSMYHCNLATAYLHRGKYARAQDEYRKVLQIEPNHEMAKAKLKILADRGIRD